jgi:undecaprenyl-diphosphatase
MDIIRAIIVSIVEGLTEYLPVSSTGHMIITEELLQIPSTDFTKMFTVAIQLGAILAVVLLYYKKFFDFKRWQFYLKLAAGVMPALVLGFLLDEKIDALLDSRITVAVTLLLGGIILLFIDRAFTNPHVQSENEVSFKNSIMIGFWQCLAMIPGVSRSAASIIGGMQQRLSRHEAAEFSFFLAVPTMLAATTYKLLKYHKTNGGFSQDDVILLGLGNLVAFIVAILAIRFFISLLKKHGFRIWGIYRICLGLLLLALMYGGYIKP